jgi:site-specific DNA-cytosine methylase
MLLAFLASPLQGRGWAKEWRTQDTKGRGAIFKHILSGAHRPRAVILENVAGLRDKVFAATFDELLNALRDIKIIEGPHYVVSTRLVDTAAWGLPHSKNIIYVVCLSQKAMSQSAPLRWPRPSATTKPMQDSLQPTCVSEAELSALGPKCRDRLLKSWSCAHGATILLLTLKLSTCSVVRLTV